MMQDEDIDLGRAADGKEAKADRKVPERHLNSDDESGEDVPDMDPDQMRELAQASFEAVEYEFRHLGSEGAGFRDFGVSRSGRVRSLSREGAASLAFH